MAMLLGKYKNGNVDVSIWTDGTKERITYEDDFRPDFPETMDVNISQYCDHGCSFCYSNCSKGGKHADFSQYEKLLDSVHPYTELAINLNSQWNPGLLQFLRKMRNKKVIVNATIRQEDFMDNSVVLLGLTEDKLLWGIGVSLEQPTEEFIERLKEFPNSIVHVINGIVSPDDIKTLSDHDIKMLILGYKQVGRGVDWYSKEGEEIKRKQQWLYDNLDEISKHFSIISFDNLAVEQLDPKRLISEEQYAERYLGDDGSMSFYINLVDGYFAKNSLSSIHYPIGELDVDECFDIIKNAKENK